MARSGLWRYSSIGGVIPSKLEFAEIRYGTKSVHILSMPTGVHSLEFLEPVGDSLERLVVTDLACTDVRALEGFPNFKDVDITYTGLKRGADLSMHQRLQRFCGKSGSEYQSAWHNKNLRSLGIDFATDQNLLDISIAESIQALSLTSARKVSALPDGFRHLRELEIHGTPVFNLGSLAQSPELTKLSFNTVKSFTGGETLGRQLKDLRHLHFFNCGAVTPAGGWLGDLTIQKGEVFGPPFPFSLEDWLDLAIQQQRPWTISPGFLTMKNKHLRVEISSSLFRRISLAYWNNKLVLWP